MPELNKFYETWEKIITNQFFLLMEKLNVDPGTYFDSYSMITMTIWLITGILLTYAGLKAHKILMPLAVGSIGGFFVAMVVSAITPNETAILASTLITGVILGVISIFLLKISFILVGAVFGVGLVVTAGYTQLEAYVLAALIFGIIAWFLYNFTVIMITCFSGSILMTYALLNFWVLLRSNGAQIYVKSMSLFTKKLLEPIFNPEMFSNAFAQLKMPYFLFFAFFLTGFTFQYGIKLLPFSAKKKPKQKKAGTINMDSSNNITQIR